ncbi:ABC transporter permease [Candidatus Woesearchaeota archaeon]|jgi:ABC-type multidrug transport system permease subunit|nr:ABC transporter permease [Candidatus Woesearchaeota archaeon]
MSLETIKQITKKLWIIPLSIYGFLQKEFILITRKKKYLYLSLLFPLLLGLIYVFSLTASTQGVNVFVCDFDNTTTTQEAFSNIDGFNINYHTQKDCETTMIESVRSRDNLFGLIINQGFTNNIETLKQGNIIIYYDNSDPAISSIASWKVDVALNPFKKQISTKFSTNLKSEAKLAKDNVDLVIEYFDFITPKTQVHDKIYSVQDSLYKISNLDSEFVSSPIITTPKGIYNKLNIIDIGLAPLFAVLCMFLILMLCSTGVMYDRKSLLFSRIRVSNSIMISYVISKLIFFLAITIIQFLILYFVFLLFGANFTISSGLLLKALLFIALTNTLMGFIIGLISDSEGVAVLISLIISLPLMFLSGMFFPFELMPKFIQLFAKIMPLNLEILFMKKALLFGGIININYFAIPLILFIVCLFLIEKKK